MLLIGKEYMKCLLYTRLKLSGHSSNQCFSNPHIKNGGPLKPSFLDVLFESFSELHRLLLQILKELYLEPCQTVVTVSLLC